MSPYNEANHYASAAMTDMYIALKGLDHAVLGLIQSEILRAYVAGYDLGVGREREEVGARSSGSC
jgi:hypothetical protein